MELVNVVWLATGGCFVLALACLLIGYFVIVRKYDQLVAGHNALGEYFMPVHGQMYRFNKYSVGIAFPKHARRNKRALHYYSELEYREHATSFEIALVYTYYASVVLMFAMGGWLLFLIPQ